MSLNPTQLSMRELSARGYTAEVVEKYDFFTKRRHDLFGFIDILAVNDAGTLAIQATSASNVSSRRRKTNEHDNLPAVLAAGWDVRVWGWRKRSGRWELHRDIKCEGVAA